METALFDYHLPEGLIAARPIEPRDNARLLRLCRRSGQVTHHRFLDLPDLLRPSDLLVINNSRVFPARLYGKRAAMGGKVEILLLRPAEPGHWWALVRPGKKIREGEALVFEKAPLTAQVVRFGGKGERLLRFDCPPDQLPGLIEQIGVAPLPPYILKERRRLTQLAGGQSAPPTLEEEADKVFYQTVYAGPTGSVAAPTAGLHFTQRLMEELRRRGRDFVELTLHVGPGTFKPVTAERVEDHPMHAEEFTLSAEAAREINRARHEGRRIVAVGTTSVRVLETLARRHGGSRSAGGPAAPPLRATAGSTDLMIAPGFEFRIVDALITNFHLPRSTLMMLVCAFGGHALVMNAYKEAIRLRYRFYSYGDAMLID